MATYKPRRRTAPRPSRKPGVLQVFGVGILLAAVGLTVWLGVRYSNSSTSEWSPNRAVAQSRGEKRSPKKSIVLPGSLRSVAEPAPGLADAPAHISQSDFSQAFSRLDHALRVRSGGDPEQLLRMANERGSAERKACPVAWNQGEPVLMLGDPHGANLSLPDALNRCADAVEKLP